MLHASIIALTIVTAAQLPGGGAYLEARYAEDEGYFKQAFEIYGELARDGGPLADFATVRAALCLDQGGATQDAEQALRAFLDSHDDGPAQRMARGELAMILFRQGKHASAAPHFSKTLEVPVKPWWYSSYVWNAHENAVNLPDGHLQGYGFFAHVVQTSIYRARRNEAARMLSRSPHTDDRLLAVMGLLRADGEKEADRILATMASNQTLPADDRNHAGYLTALLALTDESPARGLEAYDRLTDRIWWRQAMALKAERLSYRGDFDNAWATCKILLDTNADTNETADALWRYAAALRSKDRNEEAIEMFRLLANRCPSSRRADDALYAAARLLRDAGSSEAAGALAAVADRYPESRVASEALLDAAVLLDKTGRRGDLVAVLERAAGGPLGHYHVHRAAEWLYEIRGREENDRIVVPTGTVLPLVRPVVTVQPENSDLPPYITEDARYRRLEFFGAAGLEEGEWEALDLVNSSLGGPWDDYKYRVLAETGFAHSATEYIEEEAGRSDSKEARAEAMRIYFARVHWPYIKALGAEAGVDPYLILSVGRQESTFRPALTSYAGASGLMQVMPSTAKWMADVDPNISADDAARLENPRNSLRLGAYYLRRMLNMWDGNVVYALASYNGGPGNVKKWVKSFGHEPIEDFVEKIPFSETQDYVKRVLGNYAAYYSLYVEGDEVVASAEEGDTEPASSG